MLTKLEKSEDDLVPRDILIDFVVERGAVEMRIAADEIKQLSAENTFYKRSSTTKSNPKVPATDDNMNLQERTSSQSIDYDELVKKGNELDHHLFLDKEINDLDASEAD